MIREQLMKRGVKAEQEFRWRGEEVTRLEGFSDAVFAFALTLLVVSLEVPKTFTELLDTMRGFAAFALSFVLLIQVWSWHYQYFRRYGLHDTLTTWLNAVLLFVVLFYVYPLKFLMTLIINGLLGVATVVRLPDGTLEEAITDEQMPALMIIYGLGLLAVNVLFIILYWRAYRQRTALQLTEGETYDTATSMLSFMVNTGVVLISILLAVLGGIGLAGLAGPAYFLLFPALTIFYTIRGRGRRQLAEHPRPDPASSRAS
jgi:uncharacterized membrane protein